MLKKWREILQSGCDLAVKLACFRVLGIYGFSLSAPLRGHVLERHPRIGMACKGV